jgi:hypothetical protein
MGEVKQHGLFDANLVQMAYVTNDFDQALAMFAAKGGIHHWFANRDVEFRVGPTANARCHVALAQAGTAQVELICPLGGTDHVYRSVLSGTAFQIRYHHQGQTVPNLEAFQRAKAQTRHIGLDIVIEGDGYGVNYFYTDTRALLGHYVEFLFYSPEAVAFFAEHVPAN